jgi:dihydroflavonol-4-reductase
MRRLLSTRLEVRIGGGRQARNLVYVGDVVRGLLLAEERGLPGEELILGGEDVSPRDFSRLVLAQAGLKTRAVLPVPAGLARAVARIADKVRRFEDGCGYSSAVRTVCLAWRFSSQRARRRLGYEPLPLAEGIGRTLHWIQSGKEQDVDAKR